MRTFCYLLKPKVILRARIRTDYGAIYPQKSITVDRITVGSLANIQAGMTMMLGSAEGLSDRGRQRVRSVSGNLIFFPPTQQGVHDGELDMEPDSYVTVLDDFRVWAKIPRIEGTPAGVTLKDGDIGVGAYMLYPLPVANAGPARAGDIDPNTGKLELRFDASRSYQHDAAFNPPLSSIDNLAWDIGDGVFVSGSTSSVTCIVRFPPGFRWVKLRVTSKDVQSHVAKVPVFVRDPNNDECTPHQIVSHNIGVKGQEISIRLLTDINRVDVPDGTLVMVWKEANDQPILGTCLFVGWHDTDSSPVATQRGGRTRETIIHCVDVLGRLDRLPGFTQVLERNAAADTWTRVPNDFANIGFYFHYLLQWHSTALDLADLLHYNYMLHVYDFMTLGSDADTLYNQVEFIAASVTPDYHFTCNIAGQMLLVQDPIITNVADRNEFIPFFGSLFPDIWTQIIYDGNRPPRVAELTASALLATDHYYPRPDDPTIFDYLPVYFSRAPGVVRGQGGQIASGSERVTYGEFDLGVTEGNRYARMNSPYGPLQIVMPARSVPLDFDPARLGWVRVNLTGSPGYTLDPPLSYPFGNIRWLLGEINISYNYTREGCYAEATLTLEAEVSGLPAQTADNPEFT